MPAVLLWLEQIQGMNRGQAWRLLRLLEALRRQPGPGSFRERKESGSLPATPDFLMDWSWEGPDVLRLWSESAALLERQLRGSGSWAPSLTLPD